MSSYEITRLFIHVGTHNHIVQRGTCRAHVKELRRMVEEMVRDFSTVGPWHLQLIVNKKLVTSALMHNDGVTLSDCELSMMLEDLEPLV